MIIDTHVHLQSKKYKSDFNAMLQRAVAQGVTTVIVPGTDLEESRAAIALAERGTVAGCAIYAAVGFHPTGTDALTPKALSELRALAQHPRVVAIGEIGLDYYWPRNPNRRWTCADPATQRLAFKAQLALAADLDLPVIVHDRDAHEHTLRILQQGQERKNTQRGTLHAYAGGPKFLNDVLDLGFYIGIDGPVTYKKATDLHQVARQAPLNRILLETDGPYLTPHPYRGKRNEPAYLTYVAQRIAALRETTVQDITHATTNNARTLFEKIKK